MESNLEFSFLEISNIDNNTSLINNSFHLWKRTYTEILKNSNEELLSDSFYRSKYISIIHKDEIPIALALHSILNLEFDGIIDLNYFKAASTEFKENLKKSKYKIFSIEWVTVHPEFQKRFSKVQYVDLIMGLSLEVAKISGCNAAMGYSRKDHKADKIVSKYGAIDLGEIIRHGIACATMFSVTRNLHHHPYKKTNEIITVLFNQMKTNTDYLERYKYEKSA